MLKALRKIAKLPLTLALRIPFIRKRAAWHILTDYFPDLEVNIPLGDGFWCPLLAPDSVHSFGEIFVAREYGGFLDEIGLPRRWIDLGCHAGYFSLYIAWRHAAAADGQDWRALLIDADPRMEPLARRALDQNGLSQKYTFLHGLISKGGESRDFALRDGMGSSMDTDARGVESVQKIGIIRPADILEALPPPYDLIKVDIEGAEAEFFECYKDIYTHASALVMEWHSPDSEGTAASSLRATLEAEGFVFVNDLRPVRVHRRGPGAVSSGVQLYRRVSHGG